MFSLNFGLGVGLGSGLDLSKTQEGLWVSIIFGQQLGGVIHPKLPY
jgi:hypothetical protein